MILMVRWFPNNLSSSKVFVIIFTLGAAARLLFLQYPVGNDVFRYVWEGYIQNLGFNPFKYAPNNPALAEIARGALYSVWKQINQPELAAAYPPMSLLIFRALVRVAPDPFLFKWVMIGFDLGVMAVLMLLINLRGSAPSRLILYAANPLILVYVAGEGHLDVIQVFFLCLAMYLIIFKKYDVTGFLMLGLAILTKYFALIALPFLVNAENRLKSFAVLIPLVLYLAFIDAGTGIFHSLGIFAADFHYNDILTVFMRSVAGDLHLYATLALLLICLAWICLFVHDQLRSLYLAVGCLLIFLPTLHPWYLVLIVPFLVFFPSGAWLYLQAAIVFTFPVIAVEYQTGVFQEIEWLKYLEYVPFYALLIWGLFRNSYLSRDKAFASPQTITVVVPTLNEGNNLERCLQALKNRTVLKEVIVADGGSTDQTREIAVRNGARVVESPKGRGLQIEKGIQTAAGDLIMVLHADCVAEKGVFGKVLRLLESNPDAVGGAVGMKFEQQNPRTDLIAFLNNARTFLTGIAFGDQAQFFRSEALAAMGGFPRSMLMEDVELSLRLKKVGRLVFLRTGIVVSGRRWQGNGFARRLLTVLRLFFGYLIERRFGRIDPLMKHYYEIYYPK